MCKRNYKITPKEFSFGTSYKVEVYDDYGNYCCVYEPTVEAAMKYAEAWFADADKREEANKIHGKAVQAMQKLDREAGILKGNYDGLD